MRPYSTTGEHEVSADPVERVVLEFERAFDAGREPSIDDYLEGDGPDRRRLLVELIHSELQLRLRAGLPAGLADYLARYPELAGFRDELAELLKTEVRCLFRDGRAPVLVEYQARYAQLGRRVEAVFRQVRREVEEDPLGAPGYKVEAERGRGGMGIVYKARDITLGREVAIKVMKPEQARSAPSRARFITEVRITGQLQHPGIPPVHQLGTLPDGRPFLVMKLIKGDTLEALLKTHPDPSDDRGRFLAAFEQVCHALAYAHAHGVIHRDLKPHNVMVGAFGEAQVMDWGLAKFRTGTRAETAEATTASTFPDPGDETDEGPETRPGACLGTPAYMPPEQAVGAVDQIDERSDVFGLGGILCAILTGQPPFVGDTPEAARQMSAGKLVEPAFARLDACGAEPELVALCKRCLSPEKADRPQNAGEVAAAVAGLRAAADERARQAEVERGRAQVAAAEQRKRRKVQVALAAAVGLILLGGALGAWWQDRQATARTVGVKTALKLAADLRKQYKFKESRDQLDHAAELAAGGPRGLKGEVEQARVDLAFTEELDKIRHKKWARVLDKDKRFVMNTAAAPGAYREAFKNRGFDLSADDPADFANRVADSAIKAELVAALDDWATFEKDPKLVLRLLEVARRADPGVWTDRLRDPAVRDDPGALEKLGADAADVAPAERVALAVLMDKHGLDPAPLLTTAQLRDPTNFEINFFLGVVRTPPLAPPDQAKFWGEQAMYCQAALAIRPDHAILWNRLGVAFWALKKVDLAIVCFGRATDLDREPQPGFTLYNLGLTLKRKGDELRVQRKTAEAINRYREAIDCYRRAMEAGCGFAEAANNLAWLLATGPDGVRDGKRAVEYASLACKATGNRPGCLDTLACAYMTLACEYAVAGEIDKAIASKGEALRIGSRFHDGHNHLAWLLATGPDAVRDGKRAGEYAARALREQGENDPSYLDTLACAYAEVGDFDEAVEYENQALSSRVFRDAYGPEGQERLALFRQKKPYRDPDFAPRQVAPPPRLGQSLAGRHLHAQ